MGKALVRIVVIFTTIYFLAAYYFAQFEGVDIMEYGYTLLFELIVVVYAYSEGKYHCKYLRHCALGILISDTITRTDNAFDFLSVTMHNLIPAFVIFLAIGISFVQAVCHFHKVNKIKKQRHGQ